MHIFLHTYSGIRNFEVSRRIGVFGAKRERTGLETKMGAIRRGDLIVIRDGSNLNVPYFMGSGIVVGKIFDQISFSPFRDFLWPDEEANNKILYPLRASVDFEFAPQPRRANITWNDLGQLGFRNTKGRILADAQQWGKKLCGNILDDDGEVHAFCDLLDIGIPSNTMPDQSNDRAESPFTKQLPPQLDHPLRQLSH